jgi:hypothetical protein
MGIHNLGALSQQIGYIRFPCNIFHNVGGECYFTVIKETWKMAVTSVLINKHNIIQGKKHEQRTETTPGEGTKGSDIYREGNQGSDGLQVSLTCRCA